MSDTPVPNGPSPENQPEPIVPRTIEDLLRQVPPDEECQRRAFALLQRYRGEALAAVTRHADLPARRNAVEAARATLRERLAALLAECAPGVSPTGSEDPGALRSRLADPDVMRMEREYRAEYEREVAEAEQRFHTTYLSLLSHETWIHTLDGMSPSAAAAAARANLALRHREMERELHALTAHHRERYVRRLRELVAMQEDRGTDGE